MSSEVTCDEGAGYSAHLLLVVAHGELLRLLTLEDMFRAFTLLHGEMKSTGERSACDVVVV